jgi:hypothetical protein
MIGRNKANGPARREKKAKAIAWAKNVSPYTLHSLLLTLLEGYTHHLIPIALQDTYIARITE